MRVLGGLLAISLLTSACGDEDPRCARLRQGITVCEGPSASSGFSCAMTPESRLRCAERAPETPDRAACAAFVGCLYDGP